MVLGLVAHRVPRSGLGTRRQTGCSPANSYGTVLLPYPRSLARGASLSPRYEGCGRPGRPGAFRLISLACGHTAVHGGTPSVAAIADFWRQIRAAHINSGPEGLVHRVDGPSGFTRAAENHGRTISERHNRNPQRRASRV